MPDRVVSVVSLAGPAPYTSDFDWYAGMTTPEGLRTGAQGRAARAAYAEVAEFDESSFTAADYTDVVHISPEGALKFARILDADMQRALQACPRTGSR